MLSTISRAYPKAADSGVANNQAFAYIGAAASTGARQLQVVTTAANTIVRDSPPLGVGEGLAVVAAQVVAGLVGLVQLEVSGMKADIKANRWMIDMLMPRVFGRAGTP